MNRYPVRMIRQCKADSVQRPSPNVRMVRSSLTSSGLGEVQSREETGNWSVLNGWLGIMQRKKYNPRYALHLAAKRGSKR